MIPRNDDGLTDYAYAWRNGWRWVGYYLRHGRLVAAIRQAWLAYGRGYISEACQLCGRAYFLWHSPDDLWTEVTGIGKNGDGIAGGLYCPDCFDRAAGRIGLTLKWRPEVLDTGPLAIEAIRPARARKFASWTWDDEERAIRTRMCLCCGKPGHYQSVIDAVVRERGMAGLGVRVEDGYVTDGHHRVVAARAAGLTSVPLESKDAAGRRWVRDHGYVDWFHRRFGDE